MQLQYYYYYYLLLAFSSQPFSQEFFDTAVQ